MVVLQELVLAENAGDTGGVRGNVPRNTSSSSTAISSIMAIKLVVAVISIMEIVALNLVAVISVAQAIISVVVVHSISLVVDHSNHSQEINLVARGSHVGTVANLVTTPQGVQIGQMPRQWK